MFGNLGPYFMRLSTNQIRLAATDLSSHLACRHVTTLDLSVAHQQRPEPEWRAPDLVVIQELGARHEAAYLEHLRSRFTSFVDLRELDEQKVLRETVRCMERGVEVIAQG